MSDKSFTVLERLLAEGSRDVLEAHWIYSVCQRSVSAPLDSRSLAFGVCSELILGGLATVFGFSEGAWRPWEGAAPEVIARLIQEWLVVGTDGPPPYWEFVVLELTDQGMEAGRTIASQLNV